MISLFQIDERIELLYYFYPAIERLMRCILNQAGIFDIENKRMFTFKVLSSIVLQNGTKIKTLFGDELGEDIHDYLEDTYADEGPRNKVMHYIKDATIAASSIHSAKYI